MAEVEQAQTQHEEHHVSEKAPEANGTTGEEHANGTNGTNGEAKPVETTEQNGNGNGNGNGAAHDAKAEETTVATPEGTPSKPKRSGSRVKDFFSHIFKRKPKDENATNADSPKKEKTKKEKAKKCDKTNGHTEPAATNGESEQPKPTDDAQKGDADVKAVENNLKIEDCAAEAEKVNGHEKAADGHVDESHVEKKVEEHEHAHLGQNGADEKAGEISAEQVGGDAEKRNDEKHDC